MSDAMVYSPKENIPLFRMLYYDEGEPWVEIKRKGSQKIELMPFSTFIAWLTQKATVRPDPRVQEDVKENTSP